MFREQVFSVIGPLHSQNHSKSGTVEQLPDSANMVVFRWGCDKRGAPLPPGVQL
jgi:hypothetical protein